jgi:PAT family beta-lactamase induction signal transducer AmpG
MVLGIPGLVMLARFVPPGVREPELDAGEGARAVPILSRAAVRHGLVGALLVLVVATATVALAVAAAGEGLGQDRGFTEAFLRIWMPATIAAWIQLFGILATAMVGGLLAGARYRRK